MTHRAEERIRSLCVRGAALTLYLESVGRLPPNAGADLRSALFKALKLVEDATLAELDSARTHIARLEETLANIAAHTAFGGQFPEELQ